MLTVEHVPEVPLQFLQTISTRIIPNETSSWRSIAPAISSSKLGQPQPEWNLSAERRAGVAPSADAEAVFLEVGIAVPALGAFLRT